MKILAIETSSRLHGWMARMAQAALEGAREAGAETELVARRNQSYKAEVCRLAGKALVERPWEEA